MNVQHTIIPIQSSDEDIVSHVRDIFGLYEYPYDDMDDDIILLAFVPSKMISSDRSNNFKYKYGTDNHQSLEFYGDKILYGVIASILYELFGLSMTPHFYSTLNANLTKNRLLTDLMMDKNSCNLVRTTIYNINVTGRQKFHNVCADSFEALIGAIFIHLKIKRLDYMIHIKNWLLKNTGLPFVLKKYLNDMGFEDKVIYVVNDREKLLERWKNAYELLKRDLSTKTPFIDKMVYDSLMRSYSKAQDISEKDFSFTGIIINPNSDIKQIFTSLQWPFSEPFLKYNNYIMEGYPNGIPTTIGIGSTPKESIADAMIFMNSRGYTVPMREISLQYSSQGSIIQNPPITGNILPRIIPSSPRIIPSSPKIIPSSPKIIPSSPKIIPSSPQIIPSLPQIIPSSPQIIPSLPQIIPSSPQIIPSSPQIIPSLPQIIPSSPQIIPSLSSYTRRHPEFEYRVKK
jgi:hypothetical protein